MNLLNVEQKLNQDVIRALRNKPPITIELYPLEIYFLARRCLFALMASADNLVAEQLLRRLKTILQNCHPQLKFILDRLLKTGD